MSPQMRKLKIKWNSLLYWLRCSTYAVCHTHLFICSRHSFGTVQHIVLQIVLPSIKSCGKYEIPSERIPPARFGSVPFGWMYWNLNSSDKLELTSLLYAKVVILEAPQPHYTFILHRHTTHGVFISSHLNFVQCSVVWNVSDTYK